MSKLIDQVIEQILRDIDYKDLTALEELLQRVPEDALRAYLPETIEPLDTREAFARCGE